MRERKERGTYIFCTPHPSPTRHTMFCKLRNSVYFSGDVHLVREWETYMPSSGPNRDVCASVCDRERERDKDTK